MAAVLATVTHHSHSKVGNATDAPRGQRTVTSTKVGPAENNELSDDGLEPLLQGKLQRHAGIGYEIVQSLDALVLQVVEQLPNVTHFFAAHLPVVAEPVIEVPKILPVPQRIVERRPPQMAEQLVEVPTERVYVFMVRAFSQDRVQQRLGPGWRRSLTIQFLRVGVDIPARGGLQSFPHARDQVVVAQRQIPLV